MPVQHAYLLTEKGDQIDCLFNPERFTLSRGVNWLGDSVPGRGVPDLQFAGGVGGRIDMELHLDTTDSGTSVRVHTAKLEALLEIDPRLSGSSSSRSQQRPPWVIFHWGDFHSFKAVLDRLDLTFTLFADDGTPLRARAGLGLRQFEEEGKRSRQNPTSGTPVPHTTHRAQPGETLAGIAAAVYGSPGEWRRLAEANDIDDPLRVEPGRLLTVPRRDHAGTRTV